MKQGEIWLIDLDPTKGAEIEPNLANGLIKLSSADCFQIRSLSQERLMKRLGNIDSTTLDEIKEAIRKVLDL